MLTNDVVSFEQWAQKIKGPNKFAEKKVRSFCKVPHIFSLKYGCDFTYSTFENIMSY